MMLLLSLVAAASAAVTLNQVEPDKVQTSSAPSTSACYSAHLFNGTDCEAVPMCAAQYYLAGGVNALETQAPISLEPGRVVGTNSLEIIVQHAAVLNRTVTRIVLDEGNAACNYPGKNWHKGVQTNWALDNNRAVCRDTYVSSIPWSESCALERNENATHVWYVGVGTVEYSDALGALDGVALDTRDVASVIKFAIYQPKLVRDISTAVRVYDEPRLLGAVTRQQFDFRAGTATLTVVVSLAAPLRTTSVTMSTGPAGIAVQQKGGIDNAQCGDSVDALCQQKYTYTLDPQQLCEFDGVYVFQHAIQCHPSVANTPDCPIAMTATPLTISVLLDSEDICQVVQGLLSVDGSITPHGAFEPASFAFGAVKRSFVQDQAMYFQVLANSLNGFAFETSSIALVEAENKAGVRQTLFDAASGGATPGWTFAFSADPANAVKTATTHRHEFSFLAAPAVFGDVERNVPVNSDVVVSVQVTFVNPVGQSARKRHVATIEHRLAARQVASNKRTAQADTQIQVEASDQPTVEIIASNAADNRLSWQSVAALAATSVLLSYLYI